MKIDRTGHHWIASWTALRQSWRCALLWVVSLGLTYMAGKLAVDLIKWIVLTFMAPTFEAKLILVGYLASAVVPVLLFAIPAAFGWHRLFRNGERGEVVLVLVLELVFLSYGDIQSVQSALADFLR